MDSELYQQGGDKEAIIPESAEVELETHNRAVVFRHKVYLWAERHQALILGLCLTSVIAEALWELALARIASRKERTS